MDLRPGPSCTRPQLLLTSPICDTAHLEITKLNIQVKEVPDEKNKLTRSHIGDHVTINLGFFTKPFCKIKSRLVLLKFLNAQAQQCNHQEKSLELFTHYIFCQLAKFFTAIDSIKTTLLQNTSNVLNPNIIIHRRKNFMKVKTKPVPLFA